MVLICVLCHTNGMFKQHQKQEALPLCMLQFSQLAASRSFHSQQKALTSSHQGQLIIRVTIHKLLPINTSPLQMYHIYYTIYLILTVYMHIKSLAD